MISIQTMKRMKDMKIDFSVCILHALHVLHGKIKYSVLNFMTLSISCQVLEKEIPRRSVRLFSKTWFRQVVSGPF